MKRNTIAICLAMMLIAAPVFAQGSKEPAKKLELSHYGFLKGDMFYATGGVTSFGATTLGAPQLATGTNQSAVGFTAQHTRLGLRGSVGENVKAGGLVEIDFFSNAFDANGKPRIRLAYASVAKGGFEARFGQQWDIFSPNNANTNNTNANMWYAGNRGFRRTQVQLSYKIQSDAISPMVQLSFGETAREETGLGKDNLSGMPMIQGRLSGTIKSKYIVGLSFVTGQYLEKEGTVITSGILQDDFKFSTSGISLDFNLPLNNYFSLLGEVNTGKNLNNANLFAVAGNHSWVIVTDEVVQSDKKSLGVWVNATSKLTDWMHVVVGYGLDMNRSEKYTVDALEENQAVYGNLTFPVNHGFSVSVELMNINTVKVTSIDADGAITGRENMKANVISLSGKITF